MAIALADARRRVGKDHAAQDGGTAQEDHAAQEDDTGPQGDAGERERAGRSAGLDGGEEERSDATARQLRRLALAQLQLAMQILSSAGTHDVEPAVHDARKALKRTRTIVRLLGAELPPESRRSTRDALREASRCLMEARDAAVAPVTLRQIVRREEARLSSSIGTTRMCALLIEQKATAERSLLSDGGRQRALRALADAHAELARSSPPARSTSPGAAAAEQTRLEMQKIYRRGRQQMRRAARDGQAAQLHLWRKRVKDLRHAAEALAANGPAAARKRMLRTARAADALGETLGEEHDLAMLAERLAAERDLFAQDRGSRKLLLAAIERRRRKLRKRALRDGRDLYRRTPKRFSRPLAERRR